MDITGVPLPETDIILAIELMWFLLFVVERYTLSLTSEENTTALVNTLKHIIADNVANDLYPPVERLQARQNFLKGWQAARKIYADSKALTATSLGALPVTSIVEIICRYCKSDSKEFRDYATRQILSILGSVDFATRIPAAISELEED